MAETALTVPPPEFAPQFGRNIDVPKPTIAAVNGVAWAGGFLLAQCCDLCIAANTATFAISEVKVGRGAPWAAPLSWLVPPRIALQILLTGDPLSAQRGYEIGLVNEVVPLADLRSRAQQVAEGIAANAPLSVLAAKRTAYLSRPDLFDQAQRIWEPVYHSAHPHERPASAQRPWPPGPPRPSGRPATAPRRRPGRTLPRPRRPPPPRQTPGPSGRGRPGRPAARAPPGPPPRPAPRPPLLRPSRPRSPRRSRLRRRPRRRPPPAPSPRPPAWSATWPRRAPGSVARACSACPRWPGRWPASPSPGTGIPATRMRASTRSPPWPVSSSAAARAGIPTGPPSWRAACSARSRQT